MSDGASPTGPTFKAAGMAVIASNRFAGLLKGRTVHPEQAARIDSDTTHYRNRGGSHASVIALTNDSPAVAKARGSFAMTEAAVKTALSNKADYERVLEACVSNAKIGPFTATSGVVLPFYLNAGTNFLDKRVAPVIARSLLDVIAHRCTGIYTPNDRVLIVGMEVAGGMMVSQLAAIASVTHPVLTEMVDFVYCRKRRKASGTCQQLEGPQFVTSRTADSPPLKAYFLDDCNSTGSSLRDGILLLKTEYNIEVETALYLVDRSADRATLDPVKMGMVDPVVQDVDIIALYDLAPIADIIKGRMAEQ